MNYLPYNLIGLSASVTAAIIIAKSLSLPWLLQVSLGFWILWLLLVSWVLLVSYLDGFVSALLK